MTKRRTRSLAKGAIAGLIGGIVATAAKRKIDAICAPRAGSKTHAVLEGKGTTRELTVTRRAAQETMHWGIGAAIGAAYGAAAEVYPPATSKLGASYGMALIALNKDRRMPAFGLFARPEAETRRERASELVSFVTYGVVTETVRRVVRRMID